jgi:mono/diheme cytochrome c family protein
MSANDPTPENRAEGAEPRVLRDPIPSWLIVIFCLLFFWGQLYISDHAGGFERQVYAPFGSTNEVADANPKNEADKFRLIGKDIFDKTCAACHQPNGLGKEGMAPPLAASEWVLAPSPNRMCHIDLYGLNGPITVEGKQWNLAMVAWKDSYNDEQIAAVITYIRSSWGNNASACTAAQVAAARKEGHSGPETSTELLSLPAQ